ncbi:MAG: hypothetical protein R3244_11200, partial [Thermoanaerobaculia bacterium]|nr:hypothetical protein [Thermoanaerobaculia bacterium]
MRGATEIGARGLKPGSRVGVIGGGPAGSFFGYFVLDLCSKLDVECELEIFEPRQFDQVAPHGCNMCGGIISESLVQLLAAEGIEIPDSVVQRGIDSYVLHTDEEAVRIDTPLHEKRIGAVHRGAGPRDLQEVKWRSFDGHLLASARTAGAQVVSERGEAIEPAAEGWRIIDKAGEARTYDLVVVATGINSGVLKHFEKLPVGYRPPKAAKTFIREYYLGEDVVARSVGNAMHVFLLDLPGLEFAALIPKGDYVTACLLGDDLDTGVLKRFLDSDAVRSCFPPDWEPSRHSCQCAPKICTEAAEHPYGDGLVFVGDAGATRLYKDGIGAAYRTAKAAARTVVFEGITKEDFERHYLPVCRAIESDNRLGKAAFWAAGELQERRFARRALVRMTEREQQGRAELRMSRVLWDLFTGSAPYREILTVSVHPVFVARLLWHLAVALVAPRR